MAQVVSDCACGCGTPTGNRFAPGHDQRYIGQLSRQVAANRLSRQAALGRARRISPAMARRVGYALNRR